jgi:hypothetical protein
VIIARSSASICLIPLPLALPKLMDDEDLEKLGEMYTAFTRVKCADEILRSFKHYVHVSHEVVSRLIIRH